MRLQAGDWLWIVRVADEVSGTQESREKRLKSLGLLCSQLISQDAIPGFTGRASYP